ncbi:MAG: HigA family addiction module antitoxin [Nitrospirae bacterium]|jgi:addiction module HigA family antidote|nr:HigA family addiction module antitoxin [Nitrospirota bacterium]
MNKKWRICFRFEDGNAWDVEIVDDHEESAMVVRREDLKNTDFSDIVTGERLAPLHPGIFLREILEDSGVSQAEFADLAGVSAMRVSHVINGNRPVTAELALRFGRVLGQTPQYWLNLQVAYELEKTEQAIGSKLDAVRPLEHV